IAARSASYVRDSGGWFVLSPRTYVTQAGIALALIGPSALLMGGTLTLLIRHIVRDDVESAGGWKVALLYAANTAGAAAGAFLTDFAFVPAFGLRITQFIAVALNVVAGVGAIVLSRSYVVSSKSYVASGFSRTKPGPPQGVESLVWTALALVLTG